MQITYIKKRHCRTFLAEHHSMTAFAACNIARKKKKRKKLSMTSSGLGA